jgi:hypothetical protein
MNRYREEALARILKAWLERPADQRTEVQMFGFAFETAADPQYSFSAPPVMYQQIRAHLYEHGQLIGPIDGNG